jgi:hypothetical protein
MKVFIFVGDLGWEVFLNTLERRAAFMVRDLVHEGEHKAEAFKQATSKRQRPSQGGYLRQYRKPVLRLRGPATGNEKVNEIERVTYHKWTDLGFFNPIW